jgi:tetratricopeptide (TPR) repeat protein
MLYEHALALDPYHGKVWMLLARGWERQRHFDQARNVLRRGVQTNPSNPYLLQALADLEKILRNWERARKLFAQTLEAEPKFLSAYNSWALMEIDLGNVQKGYELLVRGLQVDPSSVRLLRSLAILEDKHGRSKSARSILNRALEQDQDNPHLLYAVGFLEFKQGNPARARACFHKACQVDRSSMKAYLALAQMEEYLGNTEAARQAYMGALTEARARPSDGSIQLDGVGGAVALWQACARFEEKSKNFRRARHIYMEAVARFPSDVRLLCEYAKLELRLGNYRSARTLLCRAIEIDDGYPYAYQYLGLLEQAEMQFDAARSTYSKGIERCCAANSETRFPTDTASLYHSWALLEWKSGDPTRARNLFERGLKADRSAGWLWASYARFEADVGNDELAQHYYARAVNATPKDASIWKSWASFERSRGNQERADAYAKRAIELRRYDQTRSMDPVRPLARRRFKASSI